MISLHKKLQKGLLTMLLATSAFVGADWIGSDIDYSYCPPDYCPTTSCCDDWCNGWFLGVDALYWKVSERGIPLGTTTFDTFPTLTDEIKDSRVRNLNFRWDPGVRVTIGRHLPCDNWSLRAAWTHYSSKARRHIDIPFGSSTVFTPAIGSPLLGLVGAIPGSVVFAAARWKMHVDIVDLDIDRQFCISNCFTFTPFVGLRGMWLHQRYRSANTTFPVAIAAALADVAPTLAEVAAGSIFFIGNSFSTDFSGAGLRGGFDSEWKIGCGWSLVGSFSGALLYGHCHSHGRELDLASATAGTGSLVIRQKDHYWETRATTDAALGIRWSSCFCDCYNVYFQLGWEHHLFFDQNQFEDFNYFGGLGLGNKNSQRETSNLTLQGVTFSAGLDF